MASALGRTLHTVGVALKSTGSEAVPKSASFLECIVRYFEPKEHFVTVKCSLSENLVTLCGPVTDEISNLSVHGSLYSDMVVLQHSAVCPFANLSQNESELIHAETTKRGVAVGVAVVLESSDNRILMTKRASHLRSYPNAWVPPGGHLELNESFIQAGLRELKEETGLYLDESFATLKVLCLWEAVYPVLLGFGLPSRHHIVVYLHALVNKTWQEIQKEIELDPDEVQACTWLTAEMVDQIFKGKKDLGTHQFFAIQGNGSMQPEKLELSSMFKNMYPSDNKIYTGSQLALTKWMEDVNSRLAQTSKM